MAVPRWLVLAALVASCASPAEPLPSTSLSFHLDAGCPSPLSLVFFDGETLLGSGLVVAGDSVAYDVLAGEHRVAVSIAGTPLGWSPVVTLVMGERLRVLLRC